MNILRKQEMDIGKASDYRIGDQIQVGKYTATCQKVTDDAAIFLLDQYLDKCFRINPMLTKKGGYSYEDSALRATIASADFVAGDENLASIRDHLVPFSNGDLMRIPTVSEMFGSDNIIMEDADGWGTMRYEMDDAEQWELMKDPRNRIANQDGVEYPYGWLQNRVRDSAYFALVSPSGHANYFYAGESYSIRLVFQLAD